MTLWKPRPSGLGYAIECDFRAMLDRAIDEGVIELPAEERAALKQGNQYTDFGTVCHFYLQDGTGCIFQGPSADYAPTPEEETMAAGMTKGDVVAMRAKAREVATLAAKFLPKAPDGKPWLAEYPIGKEPLSHLPISGTLDFLSQDFSELGDLKTTSKPPEKGRVKTPHLIQVATYAWLVKQAKGVMPKKGWVLYVSSKGDWVIPPVPINFEAMGDFIDMIVDQIKYLRSDELYQRAMPRLLDERCGDHFCPHPVRCRDRIRPEKGNIVDAIPTIGTSPIKTVNIFAKKGA
jgi:hypothetical protein